MSRRGPPPQNLIVAALIAVLTLLLVLFSPESVLWFSVPLGLVIILLLPGYLLTVALFFGKVDLNLRGEAVLSFVLAIVQAAVVSLILTFTPRGLQTASLATILSLLALFLTAIAYLRWSALPRRKRSAGFGSRNSIRSAELLSTKVGRAHRNPLLLFFGVAAVLVMAGVSLTINSHQKLTIDGEKGFTEFHVSWPDGSAGAEEGGKVTAMASIVNREHRMVKYTMQLVLNHSILFGKEIALDHNQSWEGPVNFNLGAEGSQRVDFLLFKDGDLASPYLEDNLWANSAAKNTAENFTENESAEPANLSLINGSSKGDAQQNVSQATGDGSKVVVQGVSNGGSSSMSSATSGGGGSSRNSMDDTPVRGGSGGAEVHGEEETLPNEENAAIPEVESQNEEQSVNTSGQQGESGNTTTFGPHVATLAEVNASSNASEMAGNVTNDTVEVPQESNLSREIEANPPAENLSSNSPPVLTDLQVSRPSPQMRGMNLFWTANATDLDQDELLYKFLLDERAMTDWSPSNSWEWNTSREAPGDYRVRVLLRDGNHASKEGFDSYKDATFTLLPPNRIPVLDDLRANPASPQAPGVGVTWMANATDPDADQVLYRFFLNRQPVTVWSKFNTWKWETSGLEPRVYRIGVHIIDGHHAPEGSSDASTETTFNLSMPLSIPSGIPELQILRSDKSSPQVAGTDIIWTAQATDSNGDEVVYKFLLNDQEITDWINSGKWSWNTSSVAPGEYKIRVLARDNKHAQADGYDASMEAIFVLSASNGIPVLHDLSPDKASSQEVGTGIIWTASASDPDGDEVLYKYLLNDRAVTDWSGSNSWKWNTSLAVPGDYKIRVLARDGRHAAEGGFDGFKDATFTLLPPNRIPLLEELRPDATSPQAPGVGIIWTAQATDPDEDQVLYRFFLNSRPVTVWSKFNTWKWDTSGLEPGDHRIGVHIRDGHHASEESSDASQEAVFTLSEPNRIPALQSLSPDKSSPQIAGTDINWTAHATDPDGDEVVYRFLLNDQQVTDWVGSGRWSWNTTALASGEYRIKVLARDNKHAQASGFDSSKEARFTLSPTNSAPLLQDLKPDMPSPQIMGVSILWRANATDPDGDGIVFRFLQNDRAVTDWSESSSWEWNTSGASPGNYAIRVQARDGKHSGPDSFDSSLASEFAILGPNQPPTLSSLNPDMQGPQVQGATVFWKASGSDPDGDKILYRFFLNGRSVSRWSESDSWAWTTAGQPAGEYRIKVLARDGHHAAEGSYDASLEKTFTISLPNQMPVLQDLRSDSSSPQASGARVVWTASATDPDGDKIDYEFLLNDRQITDWSGSNSWTWNTSSVAPGEYRIKVLARDGNHAPEGSYDSAMERTFTISLPNQRPVLKDLVPDMSSPQPASARITWTARAVDPDGDKVVYRFLLDGKAATDWSDSGSWRWDTAQLSPGDYVVGVQARDDRHSGPDGSDSSLEKTFALSAPNQPPFVNSLEPDKPSPQAQGINVIWKASVTDPDGDNILYRFLLNGQPATRWSDSDVWNWSTKGLPSVSYRIGVQVRDGHHAPETSFDGSKETSFTLNSEIDQEIDRLLATRPGAAGQGQKAPTTQATKSSSSAPVVLGMG